VVYDEGLRSYKAIAFIESVTIGYLKLSPPHQKIVLTHQKTLRYISENYGETLWIN